MKIRIISILFISFVFQCAISRDLSSNTYRKNEIYPNIGIIEGGELFVTLGVNYERHLLNTKIINFNWKLNYSYWAAWCAGGDYYSLSLNTYKSFTNHHIEFCSGYVFITDSFGKDKPENYNEPLFSLGYKYQKPKGRLIFKIYFATWSAINLGIGIAI